MSIIFKQIEEEKYRGSYETKDLILTKAQINEPYIIAAKQEMIMMGGIHHGEYKFEPTVLQNGEEIPYKDFVKAMQGQKVAVI